MTFSQFVQMLYPLIGKEQSPADFILFLTDQIMDIQTGSDDPSVNYNMNPLVRLSPDSLTKIYNGSRSLSKKRARIIVAQLNTENFKSYLLTFSEDVIGLIASALQRNENDYEKTVDSCTELFVSTLKECAYRKKKKKTQNFSQEDKYPLWTMQKQREKIGLQKRLYKDN